MEEWEEWPKLVEGEEPEEDGGQFPCLRELIIINCPKLRMFSHHLPRLLEMLIDICDSLRELPQLLPSLRWLRISKCPKLVVLPSIQSIEILNLNNCNQITTLFDSDQPSSSSSSLMFNSNHLSSSSLMSDSDHPSSFSSSVPAAAAAPHVHNSIIFPSLRDLEIVCCPNLRELTDILPSLESLRIENCKELCVLPMLPSIKEFSLGECKGMVLNNKIVPHLSSLSSLTIYDVSDLKSLPNEFMQHLTALQELRIYHCKELMVLLQFEIGFGHLLPSSLQHLSIYDCDNLGKLPQSMCNLHCLKELIIEGARGLTSLPDGLHNLSPLRILQISNCENLESLPKVLHTLTSLQEFVIESCPSLMSFQQTTLPSALQELKIIDCKNLESLPMGLLPNLTSLQSLVLHGYLNLKSLPEELHKLMSLQRLEIKECPALESISDMGLPTALRDLVIINCGKLNSLPKGLHKLTNIKLLVIMECSFLMDCKNLEPLHTSGLHNLTSLSSLTIGRCRVLMSIPKGLLPTNLGGFSIKDCPILESLHEGLSHLTSLKLLEIQNCPMLKQRYQKREEEWAKIAQIPKVIIDHKRQ
ncbi:putative disease resistance protein At3g14460 [Telopea speciosissima]|uniref:putative disease resistance protein At3g14460 n=1 Tax=Telopea speciosissima TaxID=54955 RepID=UPI001CC6C9D0|nr:putative disease resistance protein At3g14460 [Telopea speciosissima]